MSQQHRVTTRRIYDDTALGVTGLRILVDRLWPRGVSKNKTALDEWLKDVAPSTEQRKWYDHDVERFDEFTLRYDAELRDQPASAALDHLVEAVRGDDVVLLTATRDVEHSGALVLERVLLKQLDDSKRATGAVTRVSGSAQARRQTK